MQPEEIPFKCSFVEDRPPLPFKLKGDLMWLGDAQPYYENIGADPRVGNVPSKLAKLTKAAKKLGLSLPPTFARFMGDRDCYPLIRSCTSCYLSLDEVPFKCPLSDDYLVRFLSDQQDCMFWYLYLRKEKPGHAVVASIQNVARVKDGGRCDIGYCDESFEAFLARYWLRNEMFFVKFEGDDPLPFPSMILNRFKD